MTVLEHLVGRRDLAEDLAQEVFLRVFRARKRYVAGQKFSTWLYTIANHVAANTLRSLSRRHEVNLVAQPGESGGTGLLDKMALAASGADAHATVGQGGTSGCGSRRVGRPERATADGRAAE